eukprot:NODE_7579_length_756_cov_149.663507_g7330_i0.p1 GENE.NODE_7579_length_756_cov_149.663507_g7330_i0~~NODE_7579_length_756_cov_149.663507_g7330_i0.p1  ORF type:complete len:223 (+),score=43.71 NODE_7579_length_756_cov_149.663507_g7330_i0:55-669(+)
MLALRSSPLAGAVLRRHFCTASLPLLARGRTTSLISSPTTVPSTHITSAGALTTAWARLKQKTHALSLTTQEKLGTSLFGAYWLFEWENAFDMFAAKSFPIPILLAASVVLSFRAYWNPFWTLWQRLVIIEACSIMLWVSVFIIHSPMPYLTHAFLLYLVTSVPKVAVFLRLIMNPQASARPMRAAVTLKRAIKSKTPVIKYFN